jgi:peroxiredoxin
MKNLLLFILLLISFNFYAQKNIPNIKLKNIDGKTVNLSDLTKNKTVVLSFWATWCGPCVNELDAIAEQYEDLQDDGFELIAVSIDDSRTKSRVKPLVNGKDWDYTILLDTNQELKRSLNIVNVPYVVIVKNGRIVYTHSGYNPGSEEEIIKKFNEVK